MAKAASRTLLFSTGLAALVAWNWARLEQPRPGLGALCLAAALGIAPALLPRARWRLTAAPIALLIAASISLEVSRPYSLGRLAERAGKGFLDFYDVLVPFDPSAHPLMHGVVLLAVCVFSLLGGLAVAARRPLAASLVLVAGAGWPATILPGGDLQRGSLLLIALLALVAWLRPEGGRPAAQVAAGAALVALALAASSWSAVAKGQFVSWENWDFYNRPDKPVDVEYLWRANYNGIHFPRKRTRVLTVRAPAHSAYWRATTLDAFNGDVWDEDLVGESPPVIADGVADFSSDPLLPARARDSEGWARADVHVEAFRDFHLVGPSGPVAYDARDIAGVQYASGGIALAPRPLSRGDEYTVWGFQPEPTPAQLARSRPEYPFEIAEEGRYLSLGRNHAVPPFGSPQHAAWTADYFRYAADALPYRPFYRVAERIGGKAQNPYAAVVAVEAWLRSGGGFTYDQSPPRARREPPLVAFVTRTKRGYCQHFAGAMALMLRYLGIPARVAAGFTSGTYDQERQTWSVYDRNAHTWVEVWFSGYGWLPFDPTPSRGNLGGPYTASSLSFDASAALKVLRASAMPGRRLLRFELGLDGRPGRGDPGAGALPDVKTGQRENAPARGIGTTGIVVLATLGVALLFALAKLALRRSRYLTRDPRRLGSACRRELVEYLLDQGVDVPPSAPLGELQALVKAGTGIDPRVLVEALGVARFGPLTAAPAAAQRARRELRAVRRRLRRSVPFGARLRGLFSLRSLLVAH